MTDWSSIWFYQVSSLPYLVQEKTLLLLSWIFPIHSWIPMGEFFPFSTSSHQRSGKIFTGNHFCFPMKDGDFCLRFSHQSIDLTAEPSLPGPQPWLQPRPGAVAVQAGPCPNLAEMPVEWGYIGDTYMKNLDSENMCICLMENYRKNMEQESIDDFAPTEFNVSGCIPL